MSNVRLANLGLLPLLIDIIALNAGDVAVVGLALEISSRMKGGKFQKQSSFLYLEQRPDLHVHSPGSALKKWLIDNRISTVLRAMRDHPRQITVVEPALLILTLLENQGAPG